MVAPSSQPTDAGNNVLNLIIRAIEKRLEFVASERPQGRGGLHILDVRRSIPVMTYLNGVRSEQSLAQINPYI